MPALSQQQQKLFGLALAVKRGEVPASEVSDEVKDIVDRMSEKDIEDFAGTKHDGLPKKVEAQLRELFREIMREKAISEMEQFVNETKVTPATKKFLKGMQSIKVNGLGGYMPGVKNVYWDKKDKKFYFVDFEGDYMEIKNISTLKQLDSLIKKSNIKLESINEADVVGKTIFSDGKGKLYFGYYKTDDGVEFVDYKTWKKLSFKDVSKGDTNKERVIKAILKNQKQFNKKVEFNMWSKKNNPSFEQKMDWFIQNGWINNINKGGIKESVNEIQYKDAVAKFNDELIKHPMVKKAAQHYKKTPAEIVKVLQQRLSTKGNRGGDTKEVSIDFKDTDSGINVKHKKSFNESVNEAFKHIIQVDTPNQIVSKKTASQIMALAKKGVRSKEIGLELGFTGNTKLATDTFQKVKNRIYFDLDKRESVNEATLKQGTKLRYDKNNFVVDYVVDKKYTGKDGFPKYTLKVVKSNFPNKIKVGSTEEYEDSKLTGLIRNKVMNFVKNESVNEASSKEAMGIAALTGTRGSAVQDFIDKNRINSKKLFRALKSANLQGRMNFASALSGKPGNPNEKLTIKLFGESVNERYTGNSGDKLKHKYDKNIEIELIEPTNKGWKVYQTDKGNKRKIAYFDKQDIVGNKSLFESVNEVSIPQLAKLDAEHLERHVGGKSEKEVRAFVDRVYKFYPKDVRKYMADAFIHYQRGNVSFKYFTTVLRVMHQDIRESVSDIQLNKEVVSPPDGVYRDTWLFSQMHKGNKDVLYLLIKHPGIDSSDQIKIFKKAKELGYGAIKINHKGGGEAYAIHVNTPRAKSKAERLVKIANSLGGYLADKTPQQAREIGKLLDYDTKDTDRYISRVYDDMGVKK